MATRVPLQSVVVFRKDKMVTPALNQPFDFTDDEVAQIEKVNPNALTKIAQVDVSKEPVKTEQKEPLKSDPKWATDKGGDL